MENFHKKTAGLHVLQWGKYTCNAFTEKNISLDASNKIGNCYKSQQPSSSNQKSIGSTLMQKTKPTSGAHLNYRGGSNFSICAVSQVDHLMMATCSSLSDF